MSAYDGILRKAWEVHCRLCEEPSLGISGEKHSAAQYLRDAGWETRRGLWICPVCAVRCPRGTELANA